MDTAAQDQASRRNNTNSDQYLLPNDSDDDESSSSASENDVVSKQASSWSSQELRDWKADISNIVGEAVSDTLRIALVASCSRNRRIVTKKRASTLPYSVKIYARERPAFAAGLWPVNPFLLSYVPGALQGPAPIHEHPQAPIVLPARAAAGSALDRYDPVPLPSSVRSELARILDPMVSDESLKLGCLESDESEGDSPSTAPLVGRCCLAAEQILQALNHCNATPLSAFRLEGSDRERISAHDFEKWKKRFESNRVLQLRKLWEVALQIGMSTQVVANAEKRMAVLEYSNLHLSDTQESGTAPADS
ncbi:hypothetical protein HDV03_001949 [Kappamyces sp. JEL0829]|nr:hypothetical protein HDV03_001949 [Kappamyces sp. JEL0829]